MIASIDFVLFPLGRAGKILPHRTMVGWGESGVCACRAGFPAGAETAKSMIARETALSSASHRVLSPYRRRSPRPARDHRRRPDRPAPPRPWGRLRRDEDEPQFRTSVAEFPLPGDIGVGAGEAGKIIDGGQPRPFQMRRHTDREGHLRAGSSGHVPIDALHARKGQLPGNAMPPSRSLRPLITDSKFLMSRKREVGDFHCNRPNDFRR